MEVFLCGGWKRNPEEFSEAGRNTYTLNWAVKSIEAGSTIFALHGLPFTATCQLFAAPPCPSSDVPRSVSFHVIDPLQAFHSVALPGHALRMRQLTRKECEQVVR